MSEKIADFLDRVCDFVKCKEAHSEIREELSSHIEDLKEELIGNGYSENSALDTAIKEMGNSADIGNQLNKQHKPQTDWMLICLVAFIAFIGIVLMTTCRQYESIMRINYSKYIFIAGLGICIMILLFFFDYRKIGKWSFPIFIISILFFLFCSISVYVLSNYYSQFDNWFIPYYNMYTVLRFIKQASILVFTVSFAGLVYKCRGKGSKAVIKLTLLALVSLIVVPLPFRLRCFCVAMEFCFLSVW